MKFLLVNFEFVLAKDDKITRHCICGGEKKKGECLLKEKNGGILVLFGFNSVKIFENEDTYCWSLLKVVVVGGRVLKRRTILK